MTLDQEIVEIRRHIHKNPELGGDEYNTAKFIESKLKELKIPYKRVGETGVIGTIKGSKSGKTILLRADMDALPICENNDIEYKSIKTGIMHACGHDAHVAIMLGAAKLLQQKKNELKGNVRFIFQPNEETANGAKLMIKCGALKNPADIDFILGAHVSPYLKSGKIGFKYGAMMAAVDKLKIKITGEIAHGAYPHQGKDAMVAASAFISMVQSIISRELDPLERAVITFGKISGGDACNIICKEVTLEGTVRTLNNKTRNLIKTSILKKLKGIEIFYDVKCVAEYNATGDPLINTHEITEACVKTAKEFYGENNVEILDNPSMGGEDFSEYLRVIPGNFIYIGTSKNKNTSYPWHHSNFNIDEITLPKAAKYVSHTISEFLK
ncbi:MAG: M20 family metallopeptidase [Endomicrobium sp.]|uniref:M20 metallopeptidase family protein n=1 Tax=Candidatus Endomicrobiellum pyrsonymphae TaxID=1408203 RepID=UPI00357828BA|nr:M20 family metallopeptidase [Endomicrobium sp.]